jgi:transcriptional regulator with XRE-family HTH domain
VSQAEVDLSDLIALEPWSLEWRRAAQDQFPSIANLQWQKAFSNNPELLGTLLRDILKAEKREPGRHGPRPGLDRVLDAAALDRLRGLDPARHPYSRLPFPEAFAHLVGKRSVRSVAARVEMPPARVQRLKAGTAQPTMADLERIAERFDHHPSYFVEYRIWTIHRLVVDELRRQPEVSITFYERVWQWAAGAS